MSSTKTLISVIIPAYNCARYIGRCLNSILGQTYLTYEIIVVNDASTDSTLEVLLEYYKSYPSKIKIVNLDRNSGALNARCQGILHSLGEYVVFVDSDDELFTYSLDTLQKEFETDVSAVVGNFRWVFKNRTFDSEYPELILDSIDFKQRLVSFEIDMSLCGKMYRREVLQFDSLDFDHSIPNFEDFLCNLAIAQNCIKIKCISPPVYVYYQHKSSATDRFRYSIENDFVLSTYIKSILSSSEDRRFREESLGYIYYRFILGVMDMKEIGKWEQAIKKEESYSIHPNFATSIRLCHSVFSNKFYQALFIPNVFVAVYRMVRKLNGVIPLTNRVKYTRI